MRQRLILYILFSLISMVYGKVSGQYTLQVEGYIKDSVTNIALPDVAVSLRGTTTGTASGKNGHYSLRATTDSMVLVVSCIGYETQQISLNKGLNRIDVYLSPSFISLDEVFIRPGRERYSRRDNPAVSFIEQMIARRDMNNPKESDFFNYHMYEQRTISFDNVEVDKSLHNQTKKQMNLIWDYVDTVSAPGRSILPVYNEEIVTDYYYRKSPLAERMIINGYKRAGMIEFIPEEGMKQIIDEAFQDIDVFQDNISLCLNRFVSPLSSIGPQYYKYYLLDTLLLDNELCVDVGFVPFNTESFGFVGHLFVTLDSTYFVKKVSMNTPRNINLNLIDEMSINQEFSRTADNLRILTRNDIAMLLKFYKNTQGAYARRTALYRDHSFESPVQMTVFDERDPVIESENARRQPEEFWNEARKGVDDLHTVSVDQMMAQLREIPFYYWSEKIIDVFVYGYVRTSSTESKIEMGPVNTFISGNALEGLRLRAGGGTTVNMSRQWFFDGYLAYGFKDNKLKGNALMEYSFNKKRNFRNEYPLHYLRAEYKYDINQIGQHYIYSNADNMFLMFKRRENNLLTYMQQAEFSYYRENFKGLGYSVMFRHLKEWATPDVPFMMIQADGIDRPVSQYTSAQLVFFLRWAPQEKIFQTRNYRYAITLDAPIITLTHTTAQKGILGTGHTYNRTELGVRKRFWLSPFGYIDFYGQAGQVWNKAPYPLLFIPNANLSYSIESETYSLMDPMEFINDRFVSWESTYNLNGWVFNRLPLIKKLQLREVVSFRGWFGDLSDKNNPYLNGEGLYRFPENTYLTGNTPYMEIGAGVANIFKLVRVDYVWRLSYRDHPGTPKSGIRLKLIFGF